MMKLSQAVIVEGKYDKIKLSSLIDAVIIPTDGFSIFKDREKLELIRALAKRGGIIILTDSDTAGFKIRSYLKGAIAEGEIINIYIPDIFGKERRKAAPSKEGKLGVEGIPADRLRKAFEAAGVGVQSLQTKQPITKMDLYEAGLSGTEGSRERRKRFLRALGLPELLSANALPEILTSLLTREEFERTVKSLDRER